MEMTNPVILQLVIDLALLAAVLFLLWRLNASVRNPILKSHREMIQDLKAIMDESQTSSEAFLQSLEQSRLTLKELAMELDLKEKRVKSILSKAESVQPENGTNMPSGNTPDKYAQVVEMIRKGYSEAETARVTGFTEPEIGLIIDLYRVKNENA